VPEAFEDTPTPENANPLPSELPIGFRGHLCVYCLTALATTRDHVVPHLLAGGSGKRKGGADPGVTVPACQRCNSMLGSKVFATFEDRWLWVRKQLSAKDKELGSRTCEACRRPFAVRRAWARFCSRACNSRKRRDRQAQEIAELRGLHAAEAKISPAGTAGHLPP